jgi:pyrroloquinoline quinone biosynthesis protein B
MSGFPHPFITHTMERLSGLPPEQRAKVHFIHLNHTNPALDPDSEAAGRIRDAGFELARPMQRIDL